MPLYNAAKLAIGGSEASPSLGAIDLDDDTFYVMLTTSSYAPDVDSHTVRSDVTNEVSASGTYTAGGAQIANTAVTVDNTNDRAVFDGDDVSWTSATITARYAVIYKSTGTASTDPLLAYIDFGTPQTSTNGTFAITWNSSGIITLT